MKLEIFSKYLRKTLKYQILTRFDKIDKIWQNVTRSGKMWQDLTRSDKILTRFDKILTRFDKILTRFDKILTRFDNIWQDFDKIFDKIWQDLKRFWQDLTRSEKILTRTQREIIINVLRSSCSTRYSCQIWMKLEFSPNICRKHSNIRYYENTTTGSRVVSCGRRDTTKLTVAFRNLTNAPKSDTHHWLPVLPASQQKTAWPTTQNCPFLTEGIVRWQNFVNLSNTSQNHEKTGIYKTMRVNLIRLLKDSCNEKSQY